MLSSMSSSEPQGESLCLSVLNTLNKDLNVLQRLGRGATSHVIKVQTNKVRGSKAPTFYAMKVIDKSCPRYSQIKEALGHEISIHSKLNHANVVKLVSHFQDEENHYILLQFCKDGEATQLLNRKIDEKVLRLASYQVALGLEYLHREGIVHGDLKPTNILLSDGIFKLCDFGFSMQLNFDNDTRTRVCGTPIFMAPEIFNREPYGKEVDIWSFGICLFLWQRGSSPYRSKTESQLLKEIKLCDFEYPESMSSDLKDLLRKILVKDPKKRLTIGQILKHPFFNNHILDLQSHYKRLQNRKLERVSLSSLKTPEKESYTGDDSTMDNIDDITIKKVKSTGFLHGRTINKRQLSKPRIEQQPETYKRLSTKNLKPQNYITNSMKATIHIDGSLEIQLKGIRLLISKDGEYIKIYDKKDIHVFFFEELPVKYLEFYKYASRVVGILKSKVGVGRVEETLEGKFTLLANKTDFYGEIGMHLIHHNLTEYNVKITEVGQDKPLELHPIEYICRHNNELSKALRLFLRKQKEFMAGI